MGKKLWSVLTDDMDHCMFTGSPTVERHHVFGGVNRSRSEARGFIAPLHPFLHPNGASFNEELGGRSAAEIDLELKQRCQKYYEEHYGNRCEFRREFGRSYL